MGGVRKATAADADVVADVLAGAFSTDPLFMWMTGVREGSSRRVRPFFGNIVKVNLDRPDHEVWVSDDGDGAAIWYPGDRWQLSAGEFLRTGPGSMRTFRHRSVHALRVLSAMDKAHPREPHWYLDYLGTRPERQGQGVGAAVMAPMLERCDEQGMPAYLASAKGAQSLYARHGFAHCGAIDLPRGCPPLFPMWREPR